MLFLIKYDRTGGKLIQISHFSTNDTGSATKARLELELMQIKSNDNHEIVILEAESEDQLRKTHRRYFESISTLADPNTSILTREAA